MATPDPLVNAAGEYAVNHWSTDEWRAFGRGTGTSDILAGHPRLYRSLGFGDEDYIDAALNVLPRVLKEALEPNAGVGERNQFIADYMPELATWIFANGTVRTRKLFTEYLRRTPGAIPPEWLDATTTASMKKGREFIAHLDMDLPLPKQGAVAAAQVKLADAKLATPPTKRTGVRSVDATPPANRRIFIVHGHDHAAVDKVKLYVHKISDIMPEILADLPGGGDTIIEKFEKNASEVGFAIVLLTPDDEGRIYGSQMPLQPRARQNVVLELGYFFGKLGRSRTAVLNAGVEQPSDILGVSYIEYPGADWKEQLRDELKLAGLVA